MRRDQGSALAINHEQLQTEALSRAMHGRSTSNLGEIFKGFIAMGIAESDFRPRENVFTFWAWEAVGRRVRKGEQGVRGTTWIKSRKQLRSDWRNEQSNVVDEASETNIRSRLSRSVTSFHISQTEPVSGVPP